MEPAQNKEQWYSLNFEQIKKRLGTDENGLLPEEAQKRLSSIGYNELEDTAKKSTFQIFISQFKDFLVIILIIAAIISGFLGDIESTAVILFVITMNAVLGTIQHLKAEQSLNSLKSLSAPSAKVIRNGNTLVIPVKEVAVGDILILEAGDYICADGRIIENASMKVNESALTGESTTVEKNIDVLSGTVSLGDRTNMIFSGSFLTYGRGKAVVTETGMNTEIGKIATLIKNTGEKLTPLQISLDNFGKKLSVIIMIVCAVIFAMNIFHGGAITDAFMFAIALAVAAIPEALSSIVTIVLAFSTQKLAKENAIIRKLQAVEGLGSVSVICSDKTGTLTQNKMTVKKLFTLEGIIEENTAPPNNNTALRALLISSILCNDSSNENGREIGDPTEVALINYTDALGYDDNTIRQDYPRLDEIPFDSDRKLMSTIHKFNGQKVMLTKGAVDVLIPLLKKVQLSDSEKDISEKDIAKIASANNSFSENGLRVLAFAYKILDNSSHELSIKDEDGFTFIGLISMIDPPRLESKAAVASCIKAGIRPIMITGDHKVTASAIAKEIGILTDISQAATGADVDRLTDDELENFVEKISVYARVSPENKIRIVNAWQKKGNIVAMTGDGVNDAPALKQADVGVAMGITGTEVAKEAASMVLADDNFATIVKAVENGRNVYANIKRSIQFLLSGNAAGIIAVLYASLMNLPVPFAPVHLLFINLLTDSLPAIALGVEPHSRSVMSEKPRPKNEGILTRPYVFSIVLEGAVIALATIISYTIGLTAMGPKAASTMAFIALCFSRLLHGFNCKMNSPVLFNKKMFNNKYLIGAFLVGTFLLGAVIFIPALQPIFAVTKIGLKLTALTAAVSFGSLLLIQLLKAVRTKMNK